MLPISFQQQRFAFTLKPKRQAPKARCRASVTASHICALLLISLCQVALAAPQALDRVIAIVDQDVVTYSELEGRINDIKARIRAKGVNAPSDEVLKNQVLEQLVTERLQLSMAERFDVAVSDEEVNDTIDNIMKSNEWNEEQLQANLAASQQSYSTFRANIERDILIRTVTQGVVSSRIKISEQEIDSFLKSADAQFWISPDYHLGHIFIALTQSASPSMIADAEAKAQRIYDELMDGRNFTEMAIAESQGQMALKGGDLGWRKSSDLPTLFAEAAPKLAINEVSKPLRSQAGFHILKLHDKRGETKQIVTQSKVRHILIKTSEILDSNQARDKITDLRNSILSGEVAFEDAAKDHSEDLGSRLSGGDLGWSSPGMFVPEFEATIKASAINDISQPFLSQFGWHILQVMGRRDEDMTQAAVRQKARNMLMSRRFEDEVQLWIQEMKDDAFIEFKEETEASETDAVSVNESTNSGKKDKGKGKGKRKNRRN